MLAYNACLVGRKKVVGVHVEKNWKTAKCPTEGCMAAGNGYELQNKREEDKEVWGDGKPGVY